MTKLWMSWFFSLAVIGLSGCSSNSRPRAFDSHVTVTREPHRDSWTFSYHFDRPVDGLVFQRQRSQFRSDHWISLTPGIHIERIHDREIIYSDAGTLSDFSFQVQPYFDDSPRDYDFFVPFTDGSAALYSGYLHVLPLDCSAGPGCSAGDLAEAPYGELKFDLILVPRPGENVIVNEGSTAGPLRWESPVNGSYVYFGSLAPHEEDSFRAILDPRLPSWLIRDLRNALPVLFRFYSDKLGFELNLRPLILFSFDQKHHQIGYGSSGGVVNRQIQLSVFGDAWQLQSQATSDKIFELMAHELAHFWNGDLFHSAGQSGDAWMHEGGADAFSYRAMKELGVINENEFYAKHRKAVENCDAGLVGISLKQSFEASRIKNFYDCGATIGLITDHAMSEAQHKSLFDFWRVLFLQAQANSGIYTSEMYLDLLQSVDKDAAENVDLIVNHNISNPTLFFDSIFKRYQLPLVSPSQL